MLTSANRQPNPFQPLRFLRHLAHQDLTEVVALALLTYCRYFDLKKSHTDPPKNFRRLARNNECQTLLTAWKAEVCSKYPQF